MSSLAVSEPMPAGQGPIKNVWNVPAKNDGFRESIVFRRTRDRVAVSQLSQESP